MKFVRFFNLLMLCICCSVDARAQVRIIQWTDVHSTLETLAKQVLTVDREGQDFLRKNPSGEVVVTVLGDYTSINPYTQEEGGWSAFEALRLLKVRGYTVIFVPGNHDAFDWTVKIDGPQLFLAQMKQLKEWGVHIMATNLRKKSKALKELTSSSYQLKTVDPNTHIVGLTLPEILEKSNLTEAASTRLFRGIESFSESYIRLLSKFKRQGVERAVFAVHQAHKKMSRIFPELNQVRKDMGLNVEVPLVLGAHDHRVAAYEVEGTLFSNSGAHGSMSIVDIAKNGEVLSSELRHISKSEEGREAILAKEFRIGEIFVNSYGEKDILSESWLAEYYMSLQEQVNLVRTRLSRQLAFLLEDIRDHKMHLKQGESELGRMLGDALEKWVRSTVLMGVQAEYVIAMVNSSSYRLERSIPKGPLDELTVRKMYPFLSEASLFRVSGEAVEEMYFELRKTYSAHNNYHSPHLNSVVRETDGRLEVQDHSGKWGPLKPGRTYWLVLDGWLAEHAIGESYRLGTWLDNLNGKVPAARKSYQDVLVQHFPEVAETHQKRKVFGRGFSCRKVFTPSVSLGF